MAGSDTASYEDARIERIFSVGSDRGTVKEVSEKYHVHPSYVSMARRVVNVWGNVDKNDIKHLGLARLYYGAIIAQKVGREKGFDLMLSKDTETLRNISRGNFLIRKKLPSVDEGIYDQVMEQYDRFDKTFQHLNPDQYLSFDRFLETIIAIISEIDDELLAGVIRDMWGDVYG